MSKRYRDFGLPLLLLAASGLLAVVVLWQWSHYRAKDAALKNRLAAKVEVRLPTPPAEQAHDGLPGLDGYNVTVERPLFMENRKPGEAEVKPVELPRVEHQPLAAKLMGVAFGPEQTMALFVDAQGKYKRLSKNDSIGGWKVVEIKPDMAILEQDGTREELKLLKVKPKKPGNPLAPGVPPLPGQFPGQPPIPNPFAPPNPLGGNPQPPSPDVPVETEPVNPIPNDASDQTFPQPEQPDQFQNDH
jgi:hypothetical protein